MNSIWHEWRRRRRARRVSAHEARPLARAQARAWSRPAPQDRFLALDLELSALSPRQGEILSMGWVAVDADRIPLASARHLVLRGEETVGPSAVIHGILDQDREGGVALRAALLCLSRALRGRTLLLFHGGLDQAFLDDAWQRVLGAPFLAPWRDVQRLAMDRLERQGVPLEGGATTLAALRRHWKLPPHDAHDALGDALATAELFLAQRR
ncbi:MAG: 3'-5' exonuclease [Pseudomonadales bacterium]|jgi:DNA polymerase-3 subunit epsilon|nr:3'-5' exonuclease [Pseudomonadales bacterium]